MLFLNIRLCPCLSYVCRDECSKQVNKFTGAKFRKFDTEEEAVNFVCQHGGIKKEASSAKMTSSPDKTKSAVQTSPLKMMSSLQVSSVKATSAVQTSPLKMVSSLEMSPVKCMSRAPTVSSPHLKLSALKQRVGLIEKLYEESMLKIRLELDSVKERIEAHTVAEDVQPLQHLVSELANHYRDSVTELKTEIESIKQSLQDLELQVKPDPESSDGCSGLSLFKRNLYREAVIPVATKRYLIIRAI